MRIYSTSLFAVFLLCGGIGFATQSQACTNVKYTCALEENKVVTYTTCDDIENPEFEVVCKEKDGVCKTEEDLSYYVDKYCQNVTFQSLEDGSCKAANTVTGLGGTGCLW